MKGFFGGFLLVLTCVLSANAEMCWEHCLWYPQDLDVQGIWNELVEAAADIQTIKDEYNLTAIAYLIDLSLSERLVHESVNQLNGNQDRKDKAIMEFQLFIAGILSLLVESNYTIIQFDERDAKTCNQFTCLDACSTIVGYGSQTPWMVNEHSHCPGALGAACNLLHAYQETPSATCYVPDEEYLVVAIVNSDFYTNQDESSESSDCPRFDWHVELEQKGFDPCLDYFEHRYILGTHSVSKSSMMKFASNDGRNRKYIKDDIVSFNAVGSLFTCMQGTCCQSTPTLDNTDAYCNHTVGSVGEVIVDDGDHPFLDAGVDFFATLMSV